MEYFKIDGENPSKSIIEKAVKVLHDGGIIAYPTDTLYGLGVDVTNPKAMHNLFMLKARQFKSPVSLMLDALKNIEKYSGLFPVGLYPKLKKLLPGKFTIILPNKMRPDFPLYQHVHEYKKIGWRVPDHKFCNALSAAFGKPISTTSANISGTANAEDVSTLLAHFGDRLDMVIDGGPVSDNSGSTILDFTKEPLLMLREGEKKLDEVKELLNNPDIQIKRTKFRVVFVCSGNICRSPMGEGIFKKMVAKTRFKDLIEVSSAGTLDIIPSIAHRNAEKVSKENEVDIREHVSTFMTEKIIHEADLIVCMAVNHVDYLKKVYPSHAHKVILIKEWKREKKLYNPSIADPIGHGYDFFKETFREIQVELKRIFPTIISELKIFLSYNDIEMPS